MAQIKLRFVTAGDFISGMIRFFTDFPYSHVEFVLDADWEPYTKQAPTSVMGTEDYGVLGAHFSGGIKIRPTNYDNFTAIENVYVECTDAQKAAVMASAVKAIGTPYDVVEIAGILFHQNWHEKAHEICSFYCTSELVSNGIHVLRLFHNMRSITPRDLYLSPLFQRAA